VLRQPLVDERVVRAQQFQRATIIAQNVAEQHLRLAAEALANVVVEVREHQQVGRDLRLEVAKLEPLAGEVIDESIRALIRDHPLHLRCKYAGPSELTRRGQIEQALVGDATPQEEGQARREIYVANRVRGARPDTGGVAFPAVKELRARKHTSQAAQGGLV